MIQDSQEIMNVRKETIIAIIILFQIPYSCKVWLKYIPVLNLDDIIAIIKKMQLQAVKLQTCL